MSKSNKKDMGKGIRALLSNIEKTESTSKKDLVSGGQKLVANELSLKYIEPNPFQPRRTFDDEELEQLTYKKLQSRLKRQQLKQNGKKEELIVRLLEAGF